MDYEFIREIFNECSGNQMRDVFIEEIETDNPDDYIMRYLIGSEIVKEKTVSDDGSIVYDVLMDGLRHRFSFTQF